MVAAVPIKSYLAHAVEGQRDQLGRTLRALEGCAIVPATNRDVVVLVTDTADETAEQDLQERLAQVPGLQCLTLVAGLDDTAETLFAEDDHDPP
jgi:nitrate reductase NapAB chaperone NapD